MTTNDETEVLTEFFLQDYFKSLKWSEDCGDYIKTIVFGNLRSYHKFLYDNYFLNEENIFDYSKSEIEK